MTCATAISYAFWAIVLAGQIVVGAHAFRHRNRGLALYLSIDALISVAMFGVSRFGSPFTYYRCYEASILLDFGAQCVLLSAVLSRIRRTGLPDRKAFIGIQAYAVLAAVAATLTIRIPLILDRGNPYQWIAIFDHATTHWMGLMLVALPFYSLIVDSARCTRLVSLYVGVAVYVGAHCGLMDIFISTKAQHLASFAHISDAVYLVSLVCWFFSSRHPFGFHEWNREDTIALKSALRSRRSYISEQQ